MNKLKYLTLFFDNILITPVLIAKVILGQKSGSKTNVSLLYKFAFFARGIKTLVQIKFGLVKKISVLFVTSNHYEAKEVETVYDKFISPFVDFIEMHKKKFKIARYSNDFNIPENYFSKRQLINLQEAGVLYSKLKKKPSDFSTDSQISEFLTGVKNLKLTKNLNPENKKYLQQFLALKELFKDYLKKSRVQHIVIVCYYDFKSFAMIKAANELNIPTIDLQHGVQGNEHFAYNFWPIDVVTSSGLFPTHFWCWDDWSASVIKLWFPNADNVITAYNVWMKDRVKPMQRNLITFTAQPIENAIPLELIEAIKNYKGKLTWCIRLHPHQLNEFCVYEKLLKDHEILDHVIFGEANHQPLSQLLNKTFVHITNYSSVILEAMWFGIPSIVISEFGLNCFKNQIPQEMLIPAYSKTTILVELNNLETKGSFGQFRHESNQNFAELANKFFKYNG